MLVHQSSTRRKACSACVQAKRRCDLRLPQCGRCVKRNITDCKYITSSKPITSTKPKQQTTSPQEEISPLQNSTPIYLPEYTINSPPDLDLPLLPLTTLLFPTHTVISQPQITFCITHFKSLLTSQIAQNQSPFIHPASYSQLSSPPIHFQDLLGTLAMYLQKTAQNESLVLSMLETRISTLITAEKGGAWGVEDYLLGVQVLVLYQIIRLYDGDDRLRQEGEKNLEILEAWTRRLSSTCNTYCTFPLSSSSSNPATNLYKTWLFHESSRRTILMSLLLQAIYSLTTNGFCSTVPLMATLPLSVDGTLWELGEEDWWMATCGMGGELVTYGDFTGRWGRGEVGCKGAFERILMGACRHNVKSLPVLDVVFLEGC